jgi:hypothetical protein
MILTGAILIMGFATVGLSLELALQLREQSSFLKGASKKLTKSLSWQMLGECAIGAGTLVLAIAAHRGALQDWSMELQSTIRLAMLLATSATSLHLFLTVRDLKG